MRIFGSIRELVAVVFRQNSQEISLDSNQATTYTSARVHQLPPGDSSQILVSATSVSTLTNKTFDADATGNSISNIENADIKAAAAIDASKVADGSVSNAEFQYISTVTSNVQNQLDQGVLDLTNHAADTSTHGISSTIAGISEVQTFTNKSIDADTNTITNIDNADIKAAAGITLSKLAAVTASRAIVSDGSGVIQAHGLTTTTEIGYVSGVTSAIQPQFTGKQANVITTQGDLVVGNASNVAARLGIGGSGTVLTSNGTTATWATAAAGESVSAQTSNYTILDNDGYTTILCNGSGTNFTITLPARANNVNRIIKIVQTGVLDSDGTGAVAVARAGSDVIGPASETSISLFSTGDSIWLQASSTRWEIVKLQQVEYVYNTNTGNTGTGVASTAYGPGGVLVLQSTPAADSGITKDVRFLATPTALCRIVFQIDTGSAGVWVDGAHFSEDSNNDQIWAYARQGAIRYGMGGIQNDTLATDRRVCFGRYAGSTSGTYAAAGNNWSSALDTKWRLAKYRVI